MMKPRIRKRVLLQFCIVMLCVVSSGLASTVTYNTAGQATGINDLNVDGSLYDVRFVFGSFNSVFAGSSPTFLGNGAGAEAAADAMLAVMLAEPTAPTIGNGANVGVLLTPYAEVSGFYLASQTGYEPGFPWRRFADFEDTVIGDRTAVNFAFAVFDRVPEPATFTLLGLGLSGLALIARRRRTVKVGIEMVA